MSERKVFFVSVGEFASLTSLSPRSVWRLIKANVVPSIRVGGRRLIPLNEAIQAIRMNNRPCEEENRNRTSIAVHLIPDKEWDSMHGKKVKYGALKARTDTDYLVFTCPQCKTELRGGAGISLKGVSADFDSGNAQDVPVMVLRIHCIDCGFIDHFKIQVDQHGHYGTGGDQ